MLGVRVTFLGAAAPWLTDGTADWFWPAAEKAGLPVMFLTAGRTAEFARIAERHPQLVLIVDHMGVVGDVVRAGKLPDAIDQTLSLAKYPNVSVKLSALYSQFDPLDLEGTTRAVGERLRPVFRAARRRSASVKLSAAPNN